MPEFSERSKKKLESCHFKLQELFNEVIKYFDCTILEGHRDEQRQNELFETGFSKVKFPDSKHNKFRSEAVDVAPYPINYQDRDRFYYFAGFVKGIAATKGINLVCGCDWDNDTDLHDQTFMDLCHFQIGL